MNETNRIQFKKRVAAIAVASCLSLAPWLAEAAGLGKLTVLSGLGQPLRAEMELGASKEELAGMTARLAPKEAFRQAGVDFASTLLDLRFAVETRSNGKSVVQITSGKPINEPFLDFLVELNWPTGRLVREYTFLLDPPEIAAKQSAQPVIDARVVETVRGGAAAEERPARAKFRPSAVPRFVEASRKPAESTGTKEVVPGDTLRKIAGETRYEGVSLEQMMVGLFRNNPDAFVGNNVNRLKSGAILAIPDKASVESIGEAEAKKVYVAGAGDWGGYRQKLAGSVAKGAAKEDAVSQTSRGKVTARVEEQVAPAEQSKDQVKVSRTEMASKGTPSAKQGDAEADRIAKDKALKEAQERVVALEKNVTDLQKMLELKTQKLAELQQSPPKPVEPAKPVEPPKPAEETKPAEAPKSVEPPIPVEPPKPIESPKPSAPPPAVAPPVEEPGLVDSLLDDPLPLAGGAGIIALLAGLFIYKRRRLSDAGAETTAIPGPSSLGPNSVFRMTGGQSVDTGNTPPHTGDFSQTGPGTIDTDEVDPVAEADVYMAYGRDTQAEEILLEALQKDPQRTAIHAKLLEIYANRRSLKQFETLASELYAQTGGVGAEWEKVAALGAGLDPNNPLYSGAKASGPVFDADATMVVTPENAAKATLAMPGAMAGMAAAAVMADELPAKLNTEDTFILEQPSPMPPPAPVVPEAVISAPADELLSLDFDIGMPEAPVEAVPIAPVKAATDEPYIDTVVSVNSNALDFDLGSETLSAGEAHAAAHDAALTNSLEAVDFSLDPEPLAVDTPAEVQPDSPDGMPASPSSYSFDEQPDVGVSTFVGGENPPLAVAHEPAMDDDSPMVEFDLDIGTPATQTSVLPVGENAMLATMVAPQDFAPEMEAEEFTATVINPSGAAADTLEFDVKLTDSVFLGQPMMQPDFDMGAINLDLGAEPLKIPESTLSPMAETSPEPAISAVAETPAAVADEFAEPARDERWEEVSTKLDLAKAYEEMGDMEGARELLQEVIGEGSIDLVEQAKSIVARLGA